MDDIVGHNQIRQYLHKLIQDGRVHHAYCFVGPNHVGKQTVAYDIAASLLQTQVEKLSTHPNFLFITTERDEKKEKTRHAIDIGQIRQMISSFSLTQSSGGYQVAIINPAGLLTTAASNALLKTLEEPRKNTVIILIAQSEDELLPTVRSRSHAVRFSPVSQSELEQYAASLGVKSDVALELSESAHGLPGLIKTWIEGPDVFKEFKKQMQDFDDLLGQPLYKKMKFVDIVLADDKDHQEAKEKMIHLLDVWQLVGRQHLYKNVAEQSTWPQDRVMLALDRMQQAKIFLRQNIQPRLLIEHVILALP
ncbi:MAG: hypothetical protein A3J66_03775 [Candidatus Magasanikbacteria bacterium RIFCSPHIGHO2_02_FULL_47_14]|uniref:DNA polymerase III subunit delta n=1 Tax=Candidatus Magasanikbacteria bacterium RIFCSPHIGHO2_02_FULL_47_14 TaxID=1798680 RepID=A0A1F6M0T6_9BACT|nr:MAG: hypothetical protein A3J66_03775 [Candidatus Magasanikbacteria bacterium RIFCSPHIGHO2_02_FULL_47_14]